MLTRMASERSKGSFVEYPVAAVASLPEEHAVVDLSKCARRPVVGEVVSIIPNHCCAVTAMMDEVYGVRGGKVETVFPVAARGEGAVGDWGTTAKCSRRTDFTLS